MSTSRRNFLGLLAGAGTAGALGLSGCVPAVARGSAGELLTSQLPLPRRFSVPLPVPPVLRPVRRDADADYYEIVQADAEVELLPGVRTRIWGYDGIFPGPTIESRSGRRTVVRHRNELPTPVSMHLHGGRTPPDSDGYPTDLILPADGSWHPEHAGQSGWSSHDGAKEYAFPLEQRATTLWYHDHRMDFTGPQVWRGLAGFHLVHDDEDDSLPLPKGDRDIPLMICDRAFAEDGSLRYPSLDPTLRDRPGVRSDYMEGVLGDVILVNGAPWPELEVSNTRYRFRILNASNARRYELALDPAPPEGGASFTQVGSDGGLLARPVEHDKIPISGAERFDVVVDFSRYPVGTTVVLVNVAGGSSADQVMRFRVVRKAKDDSAVPGTLSEIEPLRRSQATTEREFEFARGDVGGMVGWTINGEPFDPTRMDARPRLGSVEIWRFTTDFRHPVHLHLVNFQVLSRDGRDPRETDVGWKDTVDIEPYRGAEIITRFDGYRGRYVFHCHNLEHEDMMMMANFEVV